MKALVQHLATHHLDDIAAGSLANCHARGLDSIMLIDAPERRVRLFIARGGEHELYRNTPSDPGGDPPHPLSIGIHPHHADLTLHCIAGTVTNWGVDFIKAGATYNFRDLRGYRYHSPITGDAATARFERIHNGPISLRVREKTVLRPGAALSMKACSLHTVSVPEGRTAAWFVYEGREDSAYAPVCYSNAELEAPDVFDGLYQPMTPDRVWSHLSRLGLVE